jgi:hypothetical protein
MPINTLEQVATTLKGIALTLDIAQAAIGYNYIQSEEITIYKYYGYASEIGWKIKRKTLSTGIWLVASGEGDYEIAWLDKENKEYTFI